MVKQNRVTPLSSEKLSELTTPRLLAYRKKILALEFSAELSDLDDAEIAMLEPGYLYFKDSPEWANINVILKALLKDREHIDR